MNQMSARHIKQLVVGLLSAILLVVLDQITKHLAVLHLKKASSFSLIPEVFELSYLENHGAAFGILQGQKTFCHNDSDRFDHFDSFIYPYS